MHSPKIVPVNAPHQISKLSPCRPAPYDRDVIDRGLVRHGDCHGLSSKRVPCIKRLSQQKHSMTPSSQFNAEQPHTTMVCEKCGAQYATDPPSLCIVCSDERGSLGRDGQSYVTVDELHGKHKNVLLEEEPNILSLGVEPLFGVGQRALFIQTGEHPACSSTNVTILSRKSYICSRPQGLGPIPGHLDLSMHCQ